MSRRGRSKAETQAPGWLWMLFGFGLGLAVAFGLYVHDGADDGPPVAGIRDATDAAVPEGPGPGVHEAAAPGDARDIPAPGRAAPASPASRFDFYEMLPAFEVVIPEVETPAEPETAIAAIEEPGLYVLQVGSFTSLKDADRRQAEVALLGIESQIQRITIDDAVFHRVRVGPMSDLDRLNVVRRQLRDARIESLLMRAAQ